MKCPGRSTTPTIAFKLLGKDYKVQLPALRKAVWTAGPVISIWSSIDELRRSKATTNNTNKCHVHPDRDASRRQNLLPCWRTVPHGAHLCSSCYAALVTNCSNTFDVNTKEPPKKRTRTTGPRAHGHTSTSATNRGMPQWYHVPDNVDQGHLSANTKVTASSSSTACTGGLPKTRSNNSSINSDITYSDEERAAVLNAIGAACTAIEIFDRHCSEGTLQRDNAVIIRAWDAINRRSTRSSNDIGCSVQDEVSSSGSRGSNLTPPTAQLELVRSHGANCHNESSSQL